MDLTKQKKQVHAITSISDIASFKSCVAQNYEWIRTEFAHNKVDSLVTGRAEFIDTLLIHAWSLLGLNTHNDLALCAVGGYGRGQLQPYSDIDLLILSEKKLDNDTQQSISNFITFLWDIKLEVGQAVRTIKDTVKLAKDDITIATNLVESRLLAGAELTFALLKKKVSSQRVWSSSHFFIAKVKEQQARHKKFNDTSYNLEPNVKENPGCLRDIQSIGWVAKKHYQVFDGLHLVKLGYFTQHEHAELIECRSDLWRIRSALHLVAGRSENRLLFDYQTDVAKLLGYGNDGKDAVEKMMRALFRIVRRVSELNTMLLQRFNIEIIGKKISSRVQLNDEFELCDGLVTPKTQDVFSKPLRILEFLHLLADTPDAKGLDSDCIRQLRNARRTFSTTYYFELPECRDCFMLLVKHPNFFSFAWDVMYKHGVLQSYLPQWDKIAGMMQFDLFHAYTVDEHTHRLVKNVQRYFDNDTDFPRCHRIVHNLDKPELLFLASIFHDIAKGRDGDHSKLGETDVLWFCKLHDMSEQDSEIIGWLVRNHLLMSVVAQRRDIYDPDVINEFAANMKSQTHLDQLYCLTLADIRATNDNLWNDWKASLLRELYSLTQQALANGLQCQKTLDQRVADHKYATTQLLIEQNADLEQIQSFWNRMNNDYFVRFKPNQIAWHSQSIINASPIQKDDLIVFGSNSTAKAGTEMLIYGHDRPALFAQIASVIDSKNCSIHDAHITVSQDGYVFDSMIVLNDDGERLESQQYVDQLAEAIHMQLHKPGRSHQNKRKMSRQMKQLNVPTKVRFYSSQDDSTLIELESLDAPGLLAKVGHLFVDFNLTLKLAKISTIGERAEDVFIVTNQDGKALTQDQQVLLKKQIIIKLDQPEVNTAI